MPTLTAAIAVDRGSRFNRPCRRKALMAIARATYPAVMAAQRVPPSARTTSQSMITCRSPSSFRSTPARNERPIRRWISTVLPPCFPLTASRGVRSLVERGSIEYSAVTHPLPWPLIQDGTRSSTVAAQRTCVSPRRIEADPSANGIVLGMICSVRSSSGARPLARLILECPHLWYRQIEHRSRERGAAGPPAHARILDRLARNTSLHANSVEDSPERRCHPRSRARSDSRARSRDPSRGALAHCGGGSVRDRS